MSFLRTLSVPALLLAALLQATPVAACHDGSPLILDLDNDGVSTTGLFFPVRFDIDGNGSLETLGWTTAHGDAFLWLDLNHNRHVDSGRELFGDATLLPSGEPAQHGFEALAVYDTRDFGGNEDGLITHRDLIWSHLRLWQDRNRDGVSQREEVMHLDRERILAIGLEYVTVDELDGAGNTHLFRGAFVKRIHVLGRPYERTQIIDDVFFRIAHDR